MTDYFSSIADEFDQPEHVRKLVTVFLATLGRLAPPAPEADILEFGAGTGTIGLALAPHVRSAALLDNSPAMLERLRAKLEREPRPNVRVLEGDIHSLPIPAASFDSIVTHNALHHVDDVAALFARFAELLRPGGVLAAADLCTEDGSFHGERAVPHNGFDPAEIAAMAQAAGLAPRHVVLHNQFTKADAAGVPHPYSQFFLVAAKE